MTREEAIAQLKMDRDLCNFNPMTGEEDPMNEDCRKSAEALDIAIKALERQLEDAISRKAVVKYIKASDAELGHDSENEMVVEDILNMPPVTPVAYITTVKFSKEDIEELVNEKMKDIVAERKKGKWINRSSTSGCGIRFVASECSCCNKKTFFDCDQLVYRYCPNCGAKMDEDESTLKYADQDTMMPAT